MISRQLKHKHQHRFDQVVSVVGLHAANEPCMTQVVHQHESAVPCSVHHLRPITFKPVKAVWIEDIHTEPSIEGLPANDAREFEA